MSRIVAVLAVVVVLSLAYQAAAGTIATESFDYATGSLAGQNGGTGWQGAWSAAAVTYQSVVNGANLAYRFKEGATINGGDKALKLMGTAEVGSVMSRQLSAAVSDDRIYLSFLLKRASGTTDGLDFAMLWVDDDLTTGSTAQSDFPNIGLFEPFGTNHVVARTHHGGPQTEWAAGGGASATNKTTLVVARLSKGNATLYQGDYDRIDLWTFDSTNPGSVLAFRSSQSSTGGTGNGKGAIQYLGARITSLDNDDGILYDELRLGTRLTDVVPTIVGISSIEIQNAKTLDFEGIPAGLLSGTDSRLRECGIAAISATSANTTPDDIQNQTGQTGKGLFFNGSGLLVLPQYNSQDPSFPNDSHPFIDGPVFTIDTLFKHRQFGLTFQDQEAQDFTFTFYLEGELMGAITEHSNTTVNDRFTFETPFYFDRVVIGGSLSWDGWGIDNIVLDAGVPEPSAAVLLALGGIGLAVLTRRHRTHFFAGP
jgi:hypothetical protein